MVVSVLSSATLRAKYLSPTAYARSLGASRKAVVVGCTSGIGKACAHRLAEQGFTVLGVGRSREGRDKQIVEDLRKASESVSSDGRVPDHEFFPCDAFSLADVAKTARDIKKKHPIIDALVMSQGMATTQGFTPTAEGNDEKLTLHYFSRIAMANALLPALKKSSLPGGAVVLSVLSGGVHSPYKDYRSDFELKKNYSIRNAADAAGFYNDLGLDWLARHEPNVNFVHASPGFVNTNWGQEFNPLLKGLVRLFQPLGRKASDCAEYMLGPTVFASDAGDVLPMRLSSDEKGVIIMGENGQSKSLTTSHDESSVAFVWEETSKILNNISK